MRVLICGSRTFEDSAAIDAVLSGLEWYSPGGPFTVIEGGAKGADAHAGSWAKTNGVKHEQYPANWGKHGKAAGPIRNKQMLDEGKPDVVWAFVDKPLAESRGTHNMVLQAWDLGVPVRVVEVVK